MRDKIILYVYSQQTIDNYCKTICFENYEDLKSELIIQLYKMDEEKLYNYYIKNCLIYVCFTIIKRIKYGTIIDTGLFYKNDYSDLEIQHLNGSIEETFEEDFIDYELLYDKLKNEVKNLHWYNKTLFEMYYFEKLTLKQISEKTGINLKSIHYTIKITRKKLKKKLLKKND